MSRRWWFFVFVAAAGIGLGAGPTLAHLLAVYVAAIIAYWLGLTTGNGDEVES